MSNSYANQKRYHIEKRIEKEDVFIMLSWKDYTSAANELSPAAMKLFMYLAKNQDGYTFWFSSKDYCDTFNLADSTFRKAKKELLDKGYLKEKNSNQVYFNSSGAFKETKESLQEHLKEVTSTLRAASNEQYIEVVKKLTEAKLKEIEDENVYKIKIKEMIDFAESLLAEETNKEFNNLL